MARPVRAHPLVAPARSTQARVPLKRSNASPPNHTATTAPTTAEAGPEPPPARRMAARPDDSAPKPSPDRTQCAPHTTPPAVAAAAYATRNHPSARGSRPSS